MSHVQEACSQPEDRPVEDLPGEDLPVEDLPVEEALPLHGEDAPGEPELEALSEEANGPEAESEAASDPLAEAREAARLLADKLQRAEAGFVNETKRIRRQAEQGRKYAIEQVVVDLLPVMDALHSAREGLGEDALASGMRAGLDLVGKQLGAIFERHGVVEIAALGQPFDPSRHQAILMVENPHFEPQQVCEVLRPGYELNGRIVRAAEVMVVKAPTAEPEEEGDGAPEAGAPEAGSPVREES